MPPPRRLTTAQLRELEAELRVELARLERAAGESSSIPSWSTAAGLTGMNATDSATIGGLQTRSDARHDAVIAALDRLADGSYGICVDCQETIPYGRLIVMPEVTYCVGCRPRV